MNKIDLNNIHPSFKGERFRYSATVTIDDINKVTKPPKHTITVKERGRGKKWRFLGNNKGLIEYPTEAEARAAVKKLNAWSEG